MDSLLPALIVYVLWKALSEGGKPRTPGIFEPPSTDDGTSDPTDDHQKSPFQLMTTTLGEFRTVTKSTVGDRVIFTLRREGDLRPSWNYVSLSMGGLYTGHVTLRQVGYLLSHGWAVQYRDDTGTVAPDAVKQLMDNYVGWTVQEYLDGVVKSGPSQAVTLGEAAWIDDAEREDALDGTLIYLGPVYNRDHLVSVNEPQVVHVNSVSAGITLDFRSASVVNRRVWRHGEGKKYTEHCYISPHSSEVCDIDEERFWKGIVSSDIFGIPRVLVNGDIASWADAVEYMAKSPSDISVVTPANVSLYGVVSPVPFSTPLYPVGRPPVDRDSKAYVYQDLDSSVREELLSQAGATSFKELALNYMSDKGMRQKLKTLPMPTFTIPFWRG